MIDYLYIELDQPDARIYVGKTVLISGEEELDERWPNTPVLPIKGPAREVMPPANLIDGRAIAEQIRVKLARRVGALKARGLQPGLAFVRVGEDPASRGLRGHEGKSLRPTGNFFRDAHPAGNRRRRRIAGVACAIERGRPHPRNPRAGAVAAADP